MKRFEHAPEGNPCKRCGLGPKHHRDRSHRPKRPEHAPNGDPCARIGCGLPASVHRAREQRVRPEHTAEGDPCKRCGEPRDVHRKRGKRPQEPYLFVGLDGEGKGALPHRYTLLAANDISGEFAHWTQAKPGERLTTKQCLDFLLSLERKRTFFFAFSFNYDLTMMLRDLDNKSLYHLFRPELRQRIGPDAKKGPFPVKWKGYSLNLQGTKFTVRKGARRIVIWDLFKFYQSKFVNALKEWKVGSAELWSRMSAMKDARGSFEQVSDESIRDYCLEECQCLAELGRRLIESHEKAGLKLKAFYGAGSSGAAMLNTMGIREKIRPAPEAMRTAVAAAFFGGRFENSVIGAVRRPLWSYDISSAYPYHTTFLPCLLHGSWELSRRRKDLEYARAALVHYKLDSPREPLTWGPFPFRTDDGSISFPSESGGGWVWREEYLNGETLFKNVRFVEAWIYRSDCDCQPFDRIPQYYLRRLAIGKEGPGIVIKLGVNSCYGKLAQSVGSALFNSWIWAGMITSGCRSQILEVMSLLEHPSELLMVATDGIKVTRRLKSTAPDKKCGIDFTGREPVIAPPRDTGTFQAVDDKGNEVCKPLGGWEEKYDRNGVFFARPGIYFPLQPTEDDIKEVRGRGVGKGTILRYWEDIIAHYESFPKGTVPEPMRIANIRRFCGAKTSISKSRNSYNRACHRGGILPHYGEWIERRVEMSFDPMPKRHCINPDGETLRVREFPSWLESIPYGKAQKSREAKELEAATIELEEQPDGDYALDAREF